MIASIAQGLHLSLDERDHLFRLAGHTSAQPRRDQRAHQPRPAAHLRSPARHPCGDRHRLGETLRQTPLGVALTGDTTRFTGPDPQHRLPVVHDPATRRDLRAGRPRVPVPRSFASGLRGIAHAARSGLKGRALRRPAPGPERGVPHACGSDHEVGLRPADMKRFVHPEVGAARADLPDPARPGPVPLAARLHRDPGQRELREAPVALRARHPAIVAPASS